VHPHLAFGITARDAAEAALLGLEVEALGYDELWVNDTPRGDGLQTAAAAAAATTHLDVGLGVAALSGASPAEIAERVRRAEIPAQRLTFGVGSGSSSSLELVTTGVAELRSLLPGQRLAVAAVGPRMARLAGGIADAVVANWALPERLAELRELIAEGAAAEGRPPPRLVAYVRVAAGAGAERRLRAEMERYAGAGQHYSRAFQAQGGDLIGVAIESADPEELAEALAPYHAEVDTVVVRGLPAGDTLKAWLEVVRAAAPVSGGESPPERQGPSAGSR